MSEKTIADMVAGDVYSSAVVASENRFYVQVDNTILSALPYPVPQMQLTFLSIRVKYRTQTMNVISVENGILEGSPPQYHGEPEATDLGSVRMTPENALDLGIALVTGARILVDQDIANQKLKAAGLVTT